MSCNVVIFIQVLNDLVRLTEDRGNEDRDNLPKGFRDKLPNEVTTIIQLLMNRNPTKRPSAEDIKNDKFGELRRLRKKIGKKSKPSLVPVL